MLSLWVSGYHHWRASDTNAFEFVFYMNAMDVAFSLRNYKSGGNTVRHIIFQK